MLKAYSVFKDLDSKACEIIRNSGIKLYLPTKEEVKKELDLDNYVKKESESEEK